MMPRPCLVLRPETRLHDHGHPLLSPDPSLLVRSLHPLVVGLGPMWQVVRVLALLAAEPVELSQLTDLKPGLGSS